MGPPTRKGVHERQKSAEKQRFVTLMYTFWSRRGSLAYAEPLDWEEPFAWSGAPQSKEPFAWSGAPQLKRTGQPYPVMV